MIAFNSPEEQPRQKVWGKSAFQSFKEKMEA